MTAAGASVKVEIVKVQRPLAYTGAPPGWLIYTNDPQHPRSQAQEPTPEMIEAMGNDPKGYFEAVWTEGEWNVGRRVSARLW
jgi:hypothetical protein